MTTATPPQTPARVRAPQMFSKSSASAALADAHGQPLDLVCFAHLHWDFVWQRPQHLLARFALVGRVFYVEEPFIHPDGIAPHIEVKTRQNGVVVVVPHLPPHLNFATTELVQEALLVHFFQEQGIENYAFWYYTPMALGKTRSFWPLLTVYDCMDELANFKFAPPELKPRELELFGKADLVFTGGHTLYEAKRRQHPDAHPFPSSIDKAHFGQARDPKLAEPADQAAIPYPRVGFFGVVDERLDIALLGQLATNHPTWQFVIIGPVVKIDPADLPRNVNVHYLGAKDYQALPAYLKGWDVATLLFADNESTRFISPTKTPEYLAAGNPVVSTPIADVVRPYGERNLVQIAATAPDFGAAIGRALVQRQDADWQRRVDDYLATISWDDTWDQMLALMQDRLAAKTPALRPAAAAAAPPAPAATPARRPVLAPA